MIKFILLFLLITALSGCLGVGYMTFYPNKRTIKVSINCNKEEVIQNHGSPAKLEKISDIEEYLIYKQGVGWSGTMPFIGLGIPIPIPLIIPTHSNLIEVHVYENKVQDITVTFTDSNICFAGYGSEDSGEQYSWMGQCRNRSDELLKNGKEPFSKAD